MLGLQLIVGHRISHQFFITNNFSLFIGYLKLNRLYFKFSLFIGYHRLNRLYFK
jgi:hypothetical protein